MKGWRSRAGALCGSRHTEGSVNLASLKLYTRSAPLSLSQRVPILENFGFEVVDEASFRIAPMGAEPVFLHDMTHPFRQ